MLQLRLQKRYGRQGALVMRLVSRLQYSGYHITGDNAFSSVQLASDLKQGKADPEMYIPACDYTGTQLMSKGVGPPKITFYEYRNLPEDGWGKVAKYEHEWYSCNKVSVSIVHFHNKKKITLIF